MCVLIDTSCLAAVFDVTNEMHKEFKPVYDWIISRKGRLLVGGSKYRQEVQRMRRFAELLTELARQRKVVNLNDSDVDAAARRASDLANDRDLDDEHLIGIVAVSRCPIVCTEDRRAMPFLKDPKLYPSGCNKPKIYSKKQNETLLTKRARNDCCPI
jgi:hypothetical protein